MTKERGLATTDGGQEHGNPLSAAVAAAPDEYRYKPWVPGPCPEHPAYDGTISDPCGSQPKLPLPPLPSP
jgi:hypothetical protein